MIEAVSLDFVGKPLGHLRNQRLPSLKGVHFECRAGGKTLPLSLIGDGMQLSISFICISVLPSSQPADISMFCVMIELVSIYNLFWSVFHIPGVLSFTNHISEFFTLELLGHKIEKCQSELRVMDPVFFPFDLFATCFALRA